MTREVWKWGRMGGVLVLLAGHGAWAGGRAAPPPAAETRAEKTFRQWLEHQASAKHLQVRKLLRGDLDGDGAPERVALLCGGDDEMDGPATLYVVEKSPTERWILSQSLNESGPCERPSSTPLRWEALGSSLELADGYSSWAESVNVGLREGRLVALASMQAANTGGSSYRYVTDWERLVKDETSAIIPVLADAQPLPPTFNQVTFGKKHHTGKADASLQVTAFREGADAVRLRLEVRDDVSHPVSEGADLPGFIAADHLELWWMPGGTKSCDPGSKAASKNACPMYQLGIARSEQGPVDARWLFPEQARPALPKVEWREGAAEVVLPLSLLGVPSYEKPTAIAFTAAYSDSDDAPGQQTLVATSQLKWGVPASFGVLSFVEGDRRHHPTLEEALKGGNLQIETRRLKGDNLFDKE